LFSSSFTKLTSKFQDLSRDRLLGLFAAVHNNSAAFLLLENANFTNIPKAAFCTSEILEDFLQLLLGFPFFWQKESG